MSELMRNAAEGWRVFNSNGKLMVLFLAAILLLWFGTEKYRRGAAGKLLLYSCVVAACCVMPVTAAVLMKYQTRFYDYQWLWALVPVSILIAYGSVVFRVTLKEDASVSKKAASLSVVAMLAVFCLCGNLGNTLWDRDAARAERDMAEAVLEEVTVQMQDKDICLWAPEAIVEYARSYDGAIRLLYGRNMWDAALNAYSYDTYDEMRLKLYYWLEQKEPEEERAKLRDVKPDIPAYLEYARAQGVNVLILPISMPAEEVQQVNEYLTTTPMEVEAYYLYVL